jgi:hypothetical protein
MNLAKAREYFSGYYEGSLDRGLKQAFETCLREDAQLQAEYQAFERTMTELDSLRAVEVEPPADLHEKISARLDRHIWEEKRTAKPSFAGWWRSLAIASVAGAGFLFAIFKLGGPADTAQAGLLGTPVPVSSEQIIVQNDGGGVLVRYPVAKDRTIVIRSQDGIELHRVLLQNQDFRAPLTNNLESAQLLSVEVEGGGTMLIALPGTKSESEAAGEGDLRQLAKALAGKYQHTVVLNISNVDRQVSWNFDSDDAVLEARQALQKLTSVQVEEREQGVLWIQEH